MIHLTDVSYRYPSSDPVLDNISLRVVSPQYIVVCGGNGSGKSTFGYLLNGLIPHFFGGALNGDVRIAGIATGTSTASEMASVVGLVFQNPDAQLFNMTVENEIAFGLENLGLPADDIDRRIGEVASAVGITRLLDKAPEILSGGEKRLVAIASVISLDPSIIVLDEPFANLDEEAAGRVRLILKQIHRSGKTVIVIEHLMAGVLEDADRCVIVNDGRIAFDGKPEDGVGHLVKGRLVARYPIRRRQTGHLPPGRPLIAVQDLCCRINGSQILHDVSFDVKQGESVAMIGKNGAGKTTLIKHLNGLLKPEQGTVRIDGSDISGRSPREMAAIVGMCFQNPNDQFFRSSVKEELMAGPLMLGCRDEEWMNEICEMFELRGLMEKSPYRLSEGEKKRVAICSVLAMKPKALVLDEPTAGQDGRFREALVGMLKKLEQQHSAILIVTHDTEFARATTDRWIILDRGRVLTDGLPDNPEDRGGS